MKRFYQNAFKVYETRPKDYYVAVLVPLLKTVYNKLAYSYYTQMCECRRFLLLMFFRYNSVKMKSEILYDANSQI